MRRIPKGVMSMARRVLTAMTFSLWFGGFTFYAAVVIPVGRRVLGGDTPQGFITEQVSDRLNVLALVTCLVLYWNTRAVPPASRRLRTAMLVTWAVFALSLVALMLLHPMLDAMLDQSTRSIPQPATFYSAHRVYLIVATVQWLASAIHFPLVLVAWRDEDAAGRA